MPLLYNDSLDDQLAYDAARSFTGGQVSNVRSNLLGPDQYSQGVNVDIDRFGSIITRRGLKPDYGTVSSWNNTSTVWSSASDNWGSVLSPRIDSVFYFDTPLLEQLVAVSDQSVSKNTGDNSWATVSGYTPASGANVEGAQLVDKLYLTDGSGNVHSYDGTSFTDQGTGTGNPPVCKYLVTHTNRLFAAGLTDTSQPSDALYCSDLLDGTNWDNTNNQIRIGGDSGDPITGLAPWIGFNLVIFKERSIYNVIADPTASNAGAWAIETIDTRMGCISHRSIAQVGQDIFFLAPDGIRTVRSILEGKAQAVSEPISVGIQDVIDDINWSAARDQACGVSWRNLYILCVPTLSNTKNNLAIVYNTVAKAFVGTWTWDATQFAVSAFNGDLRLVQAQESGKVGVYQDYVAPSSEGPDEYQDDGADYESFVVTRGMSFGEQFNELLPNHVELELKPATSETVNLRAILDGQSESVVNQNVINTSTAGLSLPFDLPATLPKTMPAINSYNLIQNGPCRDMQFKVITKSGKLAVRSILASAYVNTIKQES